MSQNPNENDNKPSSSDDNEINTTHDKGIVNPKSDNDMRATSTVKRFSPRSRQQKLDPTNDTNVIPKSRLARILQKQTDENYSTMSLGVKQEVILLVRGMVERIVMVEGERYSLGRFEIGASADNEIDMTPYGAQDRGVSRLHAELQIIDNIVHITDLGSTNGTFINGQQLTPNESTALRKGDDILLGRLGIQVLFR